MHLPHLVTEPQNRASTFVGLLNFPAPANAFTHLCEAQKSPPRGEQALPQPPPHPQPSLRLCNSRESHQHCVCDRPPAPTELITSSGQSLQLRAENTTGLEKEKWELVGLQRWDGFVRLGAKSGFPLGKSEWRGTFPTLILAPSVKAEMCLEENAFLSGLPPASVEIPAGSLEVC